MREGLHRSQRLRLAVLVPFALVAVSVFVIVDVGFTLVDPMSVDVLKLPGLIATEEAFVTFQERVLVPAERTSVGEAEKELMVGVLVATLAWIVLVYRLSELADIGELESASAGTWIRSKSVADGCCSGTRDEHFVIGAAGIGNSACGNTGSSYAAHLETAHKMHAAARQSAHRERLRAT